MMFILWLERVAKNEPTYNDVEVDKVGVKEFL